MSLIADDLQRQDGYVEGWNAATARAAEIANNVYLHSASMTQERDFANKICPRIAKAINEQMVLDSPPRF